MADFESADTLGGFGMNEPADVPTGGPGPCFNCGEEGHMRSECPNARVLKCRTCSQAGHLAAECPDKPPPVCTNCKETGHEALECKSNRVLSKHHVADKLPEEAWEMLHKASEECDIDDFKEGVQVLSKAQPTMTYLDLENEMRAKGLKIYLIALEKEAGDTFSVIDLQGKLDCKYAVSYQLSAKPNRASLKGRWPATPDENLERLADAGVPLDRGIPKCSNCGTMGHTARACEQEREVGERVEVKCMNCGEPGHRVRDCPVKRKDKFACRNCNQPGHKAEDCDQPRSAEGVECKKCSETGHFARDCPKPDVCRNCGEEGHQSRECEQPKNPANSKCRKCEEIGHFSRDCPNEPCSNCDELGHKWRDCPKPKDWSRVQCKNCGQKGHTVVRCKEPIKENNGGFGGAEGFDSAGGFEATGGFEGANGGNDWENGNGGTAAGGWEGADNSVAPIASSGW